ncbi:FAD/NAD(P)-binding domain-containing protein [Saitoella complicata NRRL Y-17804]|uniref:FAD/NAD(P)-binding domain-containing protein n=1 Tax=Saitoella complicata (strain BCRC 22490 / CBS 7301 / JCM 7358 / NBRC 10748 / NRRL Y-17804) TaxID=698492 RepID=UPI000866AA72|nr:FAD/NAD(P)-binding domain-containing protein [Saitoella complicata NRRL Y-17804]ODQ50934.1 FAD/NAD(P)-binding domain-containing protein [Saitoella complicata NRRL Y-17804]
MSNDTTLHANVPLTILIIGAGIGGLALGTSLSLSGHAVRILEAAPEIGEVGAGIQVAPNLSRILDRWGLLSELKTKGGAVMLERNSLRRWEGGEELGTAELMPGVGEKYGAPLMVAHRADLQRVLLNGALRAGCELLTDHRVTDIDLAGTRVQLSTGEWITADTILAADGIRSPTRHALSLLLSTPDRPLPTGDAAYRVLIPRTQMLQDPELSVLINQNVGIRWMGPGRHIMAYPIKGGEVYNMVLLHPDTSSTPTAESWTQRGSKAEMLAHYAAWNPTVTKLLNMVPEGEVMEWTLNSHAELAHWVYNNTALVGDACHPMLPYVAQGAAQAVEDAAVLSTCLNLIEKKVDIPDALKVYERLRLPRASAIQRSAATTRAALHLPDGPEQRLRDAQIREASSQAHMDSTAAGGGAKKNPDMWGDRAWQEFMWGVDVVEECVDKFGKVLEEVRGVRVARVGASTL